RLLDRPQVERESDAAADLPEALLLRPGKRAGIVVPHLDLERRCSESMSRPLQLVEERRADAALARCGDDPHVRPRNAGRRVPAGREPTGSDRSSGLLRQQPHGLRRLALPVEEVRDQALLVTGRGFCRIHDRDPPGELVLVNLSDLGGHATTRYTWKTSAYSRFTFTPCIRARLRTYSAFA